MLSCETFSGNAVMSLTVTSTPFLPPKNVLSDFLYLLLLLNHFSRVPLCETPIDSSPPGSLSLGFSRQEHWSGLPFPSPMHESEKWKWNRAVVSDSPRPHGLQPTRLLRPWDFPGKSTEWVAIAFSVSIPSYCHILKFYYFVIKKYYKVLLYTAWLAGS